MEMHQIRYFLAVCDCLNFTRAAETCNVTQPALTRAVQKLEEELLCAGALGVAMSGTGTAVYGVFGSAADARGAGRSLQAPFVEVCEPVPHGVVILERRKAGQRPANPEC